MDKKFRRFHKRKVWRRVRPDSSHRSTAALGGIDFWIAESDYLKAMNSRTKKANLTADKKELCREGGRRCRKRHCCGTTCGIENTFEASSASALEEFLAQVTDF